jgi:hypothetical protein
VDPHLPKGAAFGRILREELDGPGFFRGPDDKRVPEVQALPLLNVDGLEDVLAVESDDPSYQQVFNDLPGQTRRKGKFR